MWKPDTTKQAKFTDLPIGARFDTVHAKPGAKFCYVKLGCRSFRVIDRKAGTMLSYSNACVLTDAAWIVARKDNPDD